MVKELKNVEKKIRVLDGKIEELTTINRAVFQGNDWKNNLELVEENEKKIKAVKQKIELLGTQKSVIKNNIHYTLRQYFEELKAELINDFKTKTVVTKTKEKLENKIKDFYKTKGVNIGCYITSETFLGTETFKITIYFLNDKGYKDYSLGYNEEFEASIELPEEKVRYNHNIENYVENTLERAKQLRKEYYKTTKKIEALRQKQKELYHNFRDNLQGFEYYNLEIETDLRIY